MSTQEISEKLSELIVYTFLLLHFSILNCVQSFVGYDNKNVRLAASTVLVNVSSHLKTTGKYDSQVPELLLSTVGKILSNDAYETEAVVRTLAAFGTALLVGDDFVLKAKSLVGSSNLQSVASVHGEKAAAISAEIQSILQL